MNREKHENNNKTFVNKIAQKEKEEQHQIGNIERNDKIHDLKILRNFSDSKYYKKSSV